LNENLVLGLAFTLLAFIGTLAGNFLWWFWETKYGPVGLTIIGIISLILFFVIVFVAIWYLKKGDC
jgi:hypothetical protein